MLKLIGFLIALPFIVLGLLVFAMLTPFAFVDGLAALFAIGIVVFVVAIVGGVIGLVGTVIGSVFGLIGTLLGAVFSLLAPLLLVLVAIAFVAALLPLLLPIALIAGLIWLIARAARPSAPPALPHVSA